MLVRARTPARVSAVEHRGQPLGIDGAADRLAVDRDVVHPGDGGELGHLPGDLGAHVTPPQVAQLRRACRSRRVRPSRMIVTRSAEPLDLAEDVAGEQHRAARGLALGDALVEDLLHQRVEPGGRLVEDQQLGVGRERRDERDLLPVALGVGAALLGRVELEPLEQLVATAGAGSPSRIRSSRSTVSPPDRLGHRVDVAGHVGEPAVESRRRRSTGRAPKSRRGPASVRSSPSRTRMVVDLPAPLGPRKPCTSPAVTVRSRPSRARDLPERLDQAADLDHQPEVTPPSYEGQVLSRPAPSGRRLPRRPVRSGGCRGRARSGRAGS